ncbi:MAG: PQQ-dependent sugar dehydrogenase [Anaerolineaceae bacterium]|nr:MAG: PQQ-dependent sugar dehydrogenase [Anaerolineaceae bacterium]
MRRLLLAAVLLTLTACSTSPETQAPSSPTVPEAAPTLTQIEPTPMPATPTSSFFVEKLPNPSTAQWSLVVSGLEKPVDVQHAGDDRLFVVEQTGVIRVLENGAFLSEPFLDLRDFVGASGSEQGLLGLAFHPNYAENGLFFVNYTDVRGNTVVARFSLSPDPNLADLNSLRVIIRFEQPYGNHNGGGIVFGTDGYLYIGTGDGGSAGDPLGNGQNLETYLGKILRLDVDAADPYAVPPDNPFASGGGLPEIWSYGLRNPWRFSFDTVTGDLYIADVGQGDWEEVNFQPADAMGGTNYGWNIREGAHPFAGETIEGLTDPVAEYGHDLGISVTGGLVIRDPSLPDWQGVYLYGDYGTGLIWGLLHDGQGNWQNEVLFDTDYQISSFGMDAIGRVYLIDYVGGAIYRLEPTP